MKTLPPKNSTVTFRRWSNKRFAVLQSFHKVIRIATLSIAYNLLQLQPVIGQTDSIAPLLLLELEEVETLGEKGADLQSPLMRQLLLIKNSELQSISSRSLSGLLDYYPGIDIRSRGVNDIQSDISIRGGSFDQSLVLLNGIPISDPQTGHFNLSLPIQLSRIEAVEILKGPGSKSFGPGAYAGAVNFITKPSDSLGIHSDLSIGQFNTWNGAASLHLPAGNSRNLIAASINESDGYMDNSDFKNRNLYIHTTVENEHLKANLMLGMGQKAFGANSFYSPVFPEQYEETETWLSALKLESMMLPVKIFGQLYWRRHMDHFLLVRSNPSFYENYHRTDMTGAAAGVKFSSILGFTTLQTSFRDDRIISTTLGEETERTVRIKGADNQYYTKFKSRGLLSLSAEHQLQIKRLFIKSGILFHSMADIPTNPGVYPGIDISLMVNNHLRFYLSANRSMRLPTFTDLYYRGPQNEGNDALLPERAMTYEWGARYGADWISADLSLFYRKGSQTIDWIWIDNMWRSRNLTSLDTYGGEVNLQIIPSEITESLYRISHIRLGYSYTELSKSSDNFISNYALDNLKHKFILDMLIQLTGRIYLDSKVSWQERNGSFLFYESPSALPYELAYEPYWLIDFQAGIKLKRFTLFTDITNTLNSSYRDIGSVIMPGRWIMAGIKYR
jgi:iron complex outermembrane receptor protein